MMSTPPADKGKGKQLLYSREDSPRLSPIQRPRYTSSPTTAVIQPGDSTPSPISPNVTIFSSLHPSTRLISDCPFQTPFALPVSSATSPSFHHHISLLRHLPTWFPSIAISDSDSLCLPSYLLISDILYDTQTHCGRPFPGLSCI